MAGVARAVGVLVFGLGVLGLIATALTPGLWQVPPLWSDQAWTALARIAAEWAVYVVLALSGLALRARPELAVWPLSVVVLLAGLKLGYDFTVVDPDAARRQAMVLGDLVVGVAVTVALFSQLLAEDEKSDHETEGAARGRAAD